MGWYVEVDYDVDMDGWNVEFDGEAEARDFFERCVNARVTLQEESNVILVSSGNVVDAYRVCEREDGIWEASCIIS